MELVHAAVVDDLRRHPKVSQQGICDARDDRVRLAERLPKLVPFGGRGVHRVVALLDWDHRLPSKQLVLRVHALYDAAAVERFVAAFRDRSAEVSRRNLFPEFDTPDFADLPGDESYDADLTPELMVEAMRFVSPWRREVEADVEERAVRSVRSSPLFAKARSQHPGRSPNLGDLEAVSWMPPCESGHPAWTIDVWWLTAFDGRIGKGWSFLVELSAEQPRIVAHREFTVRTA